MGPVKPGLLWTEGIQRDISLLGLGWGSKQKLLHLSGFVSVIDIWERSSRFLTRSVT